MTREATSRSVKDQFVTRLEECIAMDLILAPSEYPRLLDLLRSSRSETRRSESGESFIGENDYREALLHFTGLRTDATGFVHNFSLAAGIADALLDGKAPRSASAKNEAPHSSEGSGGAADREHPISSQSDKPKGLLERLRSEQNWQSKNGFQMEANLTKEAADRIEELERNASRSSVATITPHLIADSVSDEVKSKAFEWLRGIALSEARDAKLAAIAFDEWHRCREASRSATAAPKSNDGREQTEFELWADRNGYDMQKHSCHWLFLDRRTYAAREGWRSALDYVERVMRDGYVDSSENNIVTGGDGHGW